MGRHEHRIHWRWLLIYGSVSVLVLAAGILFIYSFVERQDLMGSIAPEPLPRVTVLADQPDSPVAAGWISLLTSADFSPVLVPAARYQEEHGVLVLCDLPSASPGLLTAVKEKLARGEGVILIGHVPRGFLGLVTTDGPQGSAMTMGEAVSPLLARIRPSYEVRTTMRAGSLIEETPSTFVDARWKESSRAAALHFSANGGRIVWFGFDPALLYNPRDRQLSLFLRTALRWADGQPISDGATGEALAARNFVPAARAAAQADRFSYSVDRLEKDGMFSVRLTNKGKTTLRNPTVRFWLPPEVRKVELHGNPIMIRKISLSPAAEDSAMILSMPELAPNQDRVMKLKAISR